MIVKNKIPFINENSTLKKTIKIINSKKLGVVIIRNKKKKQQVSLQMVILKEQYKKKYGN